MKKEVFGLKAIVKKLYEAMFLVDSTQSGDLEEVITTVKTVLERADAEIVSIRKWDQRKLAYEINGKTRGMYILSYFRADGGRIGDIEKDVQLSERIMRVLILSTETRDMKDIEKDGISPGSEFGQSHKPGPSQKDGEKVTEVKDLESRSAGNEHS